MFGQQLSRFTRKTRTTASRHVRALDIEALEARRALSVSGIIELGSLDGANGFGISNGQVEDRLGSGVSGAGDINGDGYDDVIVGAPKATNAGESYVVFGGPSFSGSVSPSDVFQTIVSPSDPRFPT